MRNPTKQLHLHHQRTQIRKLFQNSMLEVCAGVGMSVGDESYFGLGQMLSAMLWGAQFYDGGV